MVKPIVVRLARLVQEDKASAGRQHDADGYANATAQKVLGPGTP
jgi:hypothetical protein